MTVTHPQGLVTPANWKKVAVGHVSSVEPTPVRADDKDWVSMELAVSEESAKSRVDSMDLCEVSVGITCDLDETPGTTPSGEAYDAVQRKVRGNHIALLQAGNARAGSGARLRLDSNQNPVFEGNNEVRPVKVRVDGIDYEAGSESHLQAVERERTAAATALAEQKTRADAATTDLAKANARADGLEAELKKLKETPVVKLDSLVEETLTFRDRARTVLGDKYVFTGKSQHEVRLDAITLLGAKLDDAKRKDENYVSVYFDATMDGAPKASGAAPIRTDANDPDAIIEAKRKAAQAEVK